MQGQPKTDIVVTLSNAGNNALKLCGIVVNILRCNGYDKFAKEIASEICGLHSKPEAITVFKEYVVVK